MKNEKFDYLFFLIVVALLLVLAIAAHGQTASGGSFTLEKIVGVGSRQTAQTTTLNASATAGQIVAGNVSTGDNFPRVGQIYFRQYRGQRNLHFLGNE